MKILVVSGFLGAGKTTLIKKLVADAFQGEKLVIIENEFGEIGKDDIYPDTCRTYQKRFCSDGK